MEEYINEDTIIEDEIYNIFKDTVTCPLCLGILLNPVICMKCQNVFCKKCADDWSKKDSKCPNRCVEPNYQISVGKNDILSKLKFKCKKCSNTVYYDDMKKHIDSNCKENIAKEKKTNDNNNDSTTEQRESKLQKIGIEEVAQLKKEGKDLTYITGKNKKYIIINKLF
jgi:hypothetical protein